MKITKSSTGWVPKNEAEKDTIALMGSSFGGGIEKKLTEMVHSGVFETLNDALEGENLEKKDLKRRTVTITLEIE